MGMGDAEEGAKPDEDNGGVRGAVAAATLVDLRASRDPRADCDRGQQVRLGQLSKPRGREGGPRSEAPRPMPRMHNKREHTNKQKQTS